MRKGILCQHGQMCTTLISQMKPSIFKIELRNLNQVIFNKPTSKLESKLQKKNAEKDEYAAKRILWYYNDRSLLNSKETWNVLNELSGKDKKQKSIVLEICELLTKQKLPTQL